MIKIIKYLLPDEIKIELKRLFKFFLYKFRKYKLLFIIKFTKKDLKIILGAALTYQKDWFSTNEEWLDITNSNHWKRMFGRENRISRAIAEHVFEHLTEEQMRKALSNIYKYLKSNGTIRIAVPDGNNPNEEYIRNVEISGIGADAKDHKQLIKYEQLHDEMKRVGFKVTLKEGYDKYGNLKVTKIDKEKGQIIRSRTTSSYYKEYLKKIIGWRYQDSITSLIIDGEKI